MSAELIQDQSIGNIGNDYSQYGFQDKEDYVFKSGRGLILN